jgi:hypothetical protein
MIRANAPGSRRSCRPLHGMGWWSCLLVSVVPADQSSTIHTRARELASRRSGNPRIYVAITEYVS